MQSFEPVHDLNAMKNQGETTESAKPSACRLTEMRIANFKAFGDEQTLPIKPLTLIFGANSSGKSSLIHGLLLANHAREKGEVDVRGPILAGESVDLGGFGEFVYQHDVERGCTLEFTFCPEPYWDEPAGSKMTVRFEIGTTIYTESETKASGSVGLTWAGLHLVAASRRFMILTGGGVAHVRLA